MTFDLNGLRRLLNSKTASYSLACKQVQAEETELESAKSRTNDLLEAQNLVQHVAEAVQETCHQQVASIVTRCLETVFGEEAYTFKILFKRARGKTEATFALERDGKVFEDPVNEAGGGVVDVVGFALRLACLVLSRPRRRMFLALDEPMRFLSRSYRPKIRELFLALSRDMDVQFLVVTHDPELTMGKVVEL